MNIEQVKIEDLIPYANNARVHSADQIAQIASSIKEFGFNVAVLIDKNNGIIAGHGRVEAAKKLKMTEIPCVRLEHLTETQKKAYILADNRIALNSTWDEQMLGLEMMALQEEGFNLESFGFQSEELQKILDQDAELPDEFDGDTADKWQLLIEYKSENELAQAYDEAMEKGLKCKIIQ